jgi:hypothetical protein
MDNQNGAEESPPPLDEEYDWAVPIRIQRKREPGWRKPEKTRCVDRSSRFGNPFVVKRVKREFDVVWGSKGAAPRNFQPTKCKTKHEAHEVAVNSFRSWVTHPDQRELLRQAYDALGGFNLACYCDRDLPCHADVWIELSEKHWRRIFAAHKAAREEHRRYMEWLNDIPRQMEEMNERFMRGLREGEEILCRLDPNEARRILDLPPSASLDDAQKAFVALAKIHHPDVGGNPNEFMRIVNAYRSLKSIGGSA